MHLCKHKCPPHPLYSRTHCIELCRIYGINSFPFDLNEIKMFNRKPETRNQITVAQDSLQVGHSANGPAFLDFISSVVSRSYSVTQPACSLTSPFGSFCLMQRWVVLSRTICFGPIIIWHRFRRSNHIRTQYWIRWNANVIMTLLTYIFFPFLFGYVPYLNGHRFNGISIVKMLMMFWVGGVDQWAVTRPNPIYTCE